MVILPRAWSVAALLTCACESPVQDDLIDSLGGEQRGVPEGPTHRYGQPCLACHDDAVGDGPKMSVGGTVFASPLDEVPVEGAVVTLLDASGAQHQAITNCAGNFYVEAKDFLPSFPMRVEIDCPLPDGTVRRAVMGTLVNREGSCAGCHENAAPTPQSPGRVYCLQDPVDPPFVVPACNGGPNPQ